MLNDYIKPVLPFLMPKQALTLFAGFLANIKIPFIKKRLINYFIKKYHVNLKEALEENPLHYACFNDFFIRALKPGARPLAKTSIISPVDGYVSQIGTITSGQIFQAKGWHYSVQSLLGQNASINQVFQHGCFATLYLSPKDYHRVHMPINATLQSLTYIPGKLFSVQPAATESIPGLFSRNQRLVALFDTPLGPMAMILVGATIVGRIGTCWHGDVARKNKIYQLNPTQNNTLTQGDEMGYFKLGSTVILLFAQSENVTWDPALHAGSQIQFGQALTIL